MPKYLLTILCCLILGGTLCAEEEKKAGERMVLTINEVEYAFRWCPPGTFMMGSPEDEVGHHKDEKQREVTLSKGFWMLETEVTQEMWESVSGGNPSMFKDSKKLPVENVSWYDCQEYIEKLNALKAAPEGYQFSLPTQPQWEYACRAGTKTALNNDKNLTNRTGACPNLNEVGWYDKNSDRKTHEVGLKKPNAWGLYDMHGNVWEWSSCQMSRGGAWDTTAWGCRSAIQTTSEPEDWYCTLGLRLAIIPEN